MAGSADTIFAPASGFGRAAVAVIRLSGPQAGSAVAALAGPLPLPRRASLRRLRNPESGEVLDEALVLWMPAPKSFTGEDQAELHIHGSPAVRSAVLRALGGFEGCRPAEPGEFTRRAFSNGRMDLAQVEGLADLIDAETEAQRRQALRQLDGALGRAVEAWREEALQALALLEAALDFADEGDIPDSFERQALDKIALLRLAVTAALARPDGERLREGFTIVLAGAPNAGKSTLLNALARREVAIVSPIPGTTRDAIEVRCDLGGLPVVFVDTAGLRDTDDPVEQAGVARARARAKSADLVLWLVAPGEPGPSEMRAEDMVVATKAELGGPRIAVDVRISAVTGEGLERLLKRIADRARAQFGAGDAILTRERHRSALQRAADALGRAESLLEAGGPAELVAEETRIAVRAIGAITGRVDVEDMLDRLFSSFCIGK